MNTQTNTGTQPNAGTREKMKNTVKLYRCAICGQIIQMVEATGAPIICCGQPMKEIVAGVTDASLEKHVPVYRWEGAKVTVTVGTALHPMEEHHYIEWIALRTKNGWQIKYLQPGEIPKAEFALADGDCVECVYAYCNIHSLWKTTTVYKEECL